MNNYDESRFMTILVIALTMLLVIWFFYSNLEKSASLAVQGGKKNTVESKLGPVTCSQVVRSCKISAEMKLEVCDEESAKQQLTMQMGDPLLDKECQNAEANLIKDCALECRFDNNSIISVPGEIRIELDEQRDESGKCLAKGRRVVTIQGRCVKEREAAPKGVE
jgi:hypothetical protein